MELTEIMSARAIAFEEIPVIDIGAMFGSDAAAKLAVARSIRESSETVGFFYIRNHGVAEQDLARTFELSRRFFELPLDEKLSLHQRLSPHHAGYTPLLAENTNPANKGDLHESFDMVSQIAQPPERDAGAGHAESLRDVNLWPEALPELKEHLHRYFAQVLRLGHRLFEVVALSLGLPAAFFEPHLTHPTAMLRLNYYPPQPAQSDGSQIGIGAHTDYECFTILAQQPGITALQVWNGRDWIHAPPIPGAFIVNIADQMQRWTNDTFLSTRHRAINPTGRPRMSIPFFLGVNHETLISPLPSCISAERPSKYPPVIAGDYVLQRLNETYGRAPTHAKSD
jgi:isopenicillin N synthase-like dioxygenase